MHSNILYICVYDYVITISASAFSFPCIFKFELSRLTHYEPHKEFLTHLLKGSRKDASRFAKKHLKAHPSVHNLYENVFRKALYEVGELWERNEITVAEEHIATSITEAVMNELYSQIDIPQPQSLRVVLSTVENETHQVGIKMVADVFEMNGWDTLLCTANTPVRELIAFTDKICPDLLGLSASIYFHMPAITLTLEHVRSHFPELPILLGGQAFRHGGRELSHRFTNTTIALNLSELEHYIKAFAAHRHESRRPH